MAHRCSWTGDDESMTSGRFDNHRETIVQISFLGTRVKILCVSDTVMPQMESAVNLRRQYSDVELLISCGDMPSVYLEFITSVLNVPLFYVRGNHDEAYKDSPPGGEDLQGRLIEYGGLSFYGLEGSIRYNNSPIQYTEGEMSRMVLSAGFAVTLSPDEVWFWSRCAGDAFACTEASMMRDDMPHQWFRGAAQVYGLVSPALYAARTCAYL